LLNINPFSFIFASRMLHCWYRELALFLFRLICGWFYSELLGVFISLNFGHLHDHSVESAGLRLRVFTVEPNSPSASEAANGTNLGDANSTMMAIGDRFPTLQKLAQSRL